jgi:hypothetical protein
MATINSTLENMNDIEQWFVIVNMVNSTAVTYQWRYATLHNQRNISNFCSYKLALPGNSFFIPTQLLTRNIVLRKHLTRTPAKAAVLQQFVD